MRALALPLALLAASPAAAQDLSLMLDWFVNPDHAPIIVAQELGFFAEAGLTVDITAPADPSDPPRMLASGQVDLAVGYQPQLHLQVHEGLPLTRIATLVATPLNCLTVIADGPVQSVADLKGRKVGYSVPGMETALMGAMLDRAGLTLDDVELVNVGWSLSPALMTGQVDATLGGFRNFEMTQMRLEGAEGRCLFVEEQGIPAYDELILLANPETMDPDATARFVAAMERGAHYILNHPDQAWRVFRDAHPDLDDELNRQAWAATLPRFSQSPGAVDHGRYARFEAFLRDAGLIDGVLPVSALARDPGA
ncbi:Putative thiamine biosynthesis protein [Paracoccus haematequi]|jgi:ABC-type nitrate/sulfonate/bicarbonate transport systems, periplasmic components|uniref:Thiamine biosynthesis protein n=1 Tax=Paracoccus haematequi TaxID=2491866 RepID=A0A447IN31_9RHOB|nr:ABC transporter substrate-binding protein [Paracoccus haematequi]VDS08779.1 Putative thiamine biosynthesis protein [Paracoccus haematequi]